MTQQEAKNRSQEKVKQIYDLAKVLKVSIRAEQVITNDNIIKCIVIMTDNEDYKIDPIEPIIREPLNSTGPTGPTGEEAK